VGDTEDEEGEGEGEEDDDDDADEDEEDDVVGSLPRVTDPLRTAAAAALGTGHASSFAVRAAAPPPSAAVGGGHAFGGRGPHALAGGLSAALHGGYDGSHAGVSAPLSGRPLAAVPAAQMALGASFVPPHLLAAADAAKSDPFSLGLHAQLKQPRLNNML
jgi:hypothetical protein